MSAHARQAELDSAWNLQVEALQLLGTLQHQMVQISGGTLGSEDDRSASPTPRYSIELEVYTCALLQLQRRRCLPCTRLH